MKKSTKEGLETAGLIAGTIGLSVLAVLGAGLEAEADIRRRKAEAEEDELVSKLVPKKEIMDRDDFAIVMTVLRKAAFDSSRLRALQKVLSKSEKYFSDGQAVKVLGTFTMTSNKRAAYALLEDRVAGGLAALAASL